MNAHTSLVNAAIAYIRARGGYAFKVQSGILPVAGRYVHAGKPGVPDVVGVWPHTGDPEYPHGAYVGRMIAVECKTGTGRLSKVQRDVHEELRKRGALVLTIRTISELQEALR